MLLLRVLSLFINFTEAISQTLEIPSFRPRRGQCGVQILGETLFIVHVQRPSSTELYVAHFDAPFFDSDVNFMN